MKKPNFKKLALMGITGGVTLCSSASAFDANSTNPNQLLAANCGGKNGCGGNVAYQPHGCGGAQPQNYYNTAPVQGQPVIQGQPQGSCSAAQQPQGGNYTSYQSHGCGGAQPQNYNAPRPQAGCGNQQRASGCGAQTRPQGSCNASPMAQGSCGARSNNNSNSNQSKNFSQWETSNKIATADTAARPTEDAKVLSQLNEEGKSIYRGLDATGKEMANRAVNQSCKGQNDCQGLNSCKGSDHSCAGKGSCKGTASGPFKDKNQAVKIVAQKLSEKRASANAPRY